MDRVQHRHRAGLKQWMVGAIEHGHVLLQEVAQRVNERDGNAEVAGRIRSIQAETDENAFCCTAAARSYSCSETSGRSRCSNAG
jgi:hypothetical protein